MPKQKVRKRVLSVLLIVGERNILERSGKCLFSVIISLVLISLHNHSIPPHNPFIVHFRLFHYVSPFCGNPPAVAAQIIPMHEGEQLCPFKVAAHPKKRMEIIKIRPKSFCHMFRNITIEFLIRSKKRKAKLSAIFKIGAMYSPRKNSELP